MPFVTERTPEGLLRGKIKVVIKFNYQHDATTLIRACQQHPTLGVRFDLWCLDDLCPIRGELNRLFYAIFHGDFHLGLENAFANIIFSYGVYTYTIYRLHPAAEIGKLIDTGEPASDIRDWLVKQGAPVMERWTIVMRTSKGKEIISKNQSVD